MPNAPASYNDITATPWPRLAVYAANGQFPTEEDEQPYWHCLEITKGAGVVPTCELRRDLGDAGTRLTNIRLDGQANWIVEVWGLNLDGSRLMCLFMGEVVETQFALDKDNEFETATATIPHYRFGDLCFGQEVWNPHTQEMTVVHLPLEFNPEVDLVIVPNMAQPRQGYAHWIDPESQRTASAISFQSTTVSSWTLRDVVDTLCRGLNFGQSFVMNPALEDEWGSDAPAVRNIVLPAGHYLIDYLSMILRPFGYDWYIEPSIDALSGQALPQIVIFARGTGNRNATDLYLDPIGNSIEFSQVEAISFNYNVANVKNEVTLHGSLKEKEFTVELYRTWAESDDAEVDEEDPLDKVGRKWAANEAGDYTGLRPEITEVPNFGDDYIPKRRKAQDLLRWNDDETMTTREHAFLEWSLDDGETWEHVEKSWRLLIDECGVWFSKPPSELETTEEMTPRLRITCTLISDKRISATYTDAQSINGQTVKALIDAKDRFHYRQIEDEGDFASELSGDGDTIDDSGDTMQNYLDPLGEIQRAASVGCSPVLHGIHIDRKIGQLLRGVVGRNISFNAIPFGGAERYPQVTGVRWVFQGECKTYLTVTPYSSQNPDQRIRRRPKK